jgi:hypothetical protein
MEVKYARNVRLSPLIQRVSIFFFTGTATGSTAAPMVLSIGADDSVAQDQEVTIDGAFVRDWTTGWSSPISASA